MLELPIEPHQGIGPIKLGMKRRAVRDVMISLGFALCAEHGKLDYFCDDSIQVEYTKETVSFIGIASYAKHFHCTYHGRDVFDTPASVLFALISAGESAPDTFLPNQNCFPDQIVTVWNADEQYDYKGGEQRPIYAQVGVGDTRYMNACIRK